MKKNEQVDLQVVALMAAVSGRRTAREAVDFALAVWDELNARFRAPTIPEPARWPATGRDFMRLIVRGKTEADSVARLRRFFFDQKRESLLFGGCLDEESRREAEAYAAAMVGKMRAPDYRMEQTGWHRVARDYLAWWQQELSARRRQAAKRGT